MFTTRTAAAIAALLFCYATVAGGQAIDHTRQERLRANDKARVAIDSARGIIVITVGPVDIPAGVPYNEHVAPAPIDVAWPVSGWIRGFRMDLVDSCGRVLPREMLHHAGVVNADRRQLVSPAAERLIAASRETEEVQLPASMGVPLTLGSHLV